MSDEVIETVECMHFWIIDQPNGPTSMGVCKLCGVTQVFRNSIPGSGWDRDGVQGRRGRPKRS